MIGEKRKIKKMEKKKRRQGQNGHDALFIWKLCINNRLNFLQSFSSLFAFKRSPLDLFLLVEALLLYIVN